jgi:hypothetical protein
VREVIERMDLGRQVVPFRRCIACNGIIESVPKQDIEDQLEPLTRRYYEKFYRCGDCGKIYWEGSHFRKMRDLVRRLTG